MTDRNGIDASAVIGAYFAEQTAKARAEAEKANAALAQAEKEAAAFAERQELPPAVGAMKQGWELASWSTDRATHIAQAALDGKASPEQYQQAKAERTAVLAWLEANGYEVPGPFKD
ncbi:hypothetical protein FCH28_37640 [Streptomyces piniterrae]|uniref:Uncharacterized protein n=1 Tax=Streptomyces piniterrae TaxID=2571125 RepID=A0A4U0MKU0_9ACTN|nr:hypothetical protein [Streptomyces piniterrae]TJZ41211.1 hypothetical protein FCH28_37640 [Streptomyces piniterrae]